MSENLLMDDDNKNNLKKPLIYGALAFLIFIIAVIVVALFQNSKSENEIVPVETKPQEVSPKMQPPKKEQSNFQPLKVEEPPKIDKEQLVEEKPVEKSDETEKNEKKVEKNEASEVSEKKVIEKKPKNEKNTQKTLNGSYYIQVAALLKHAKPNKNFLKIIEKNGFNYRFYVTYINKNGKKIKVTKILIGPFKTRDEAKKALIKVKQKITQNAFIFKVK